MAACGGGDCLLSSFSSLWAKAITEENGGYGIQRNTRLDWRVFGKHITARDTLGGCLTRNIDGYRLLRYSTDSLAPAMHKHGCEAPRLCSSSFWIEHEEGAFHPKAFHCCLFRSARTIRCEPGGPQGVPMCNTENSLTLVHILLFHGGLGLSYSQCFPKDRRGRFLSACVGMQTGSRCEIDRPRG